MVEVIINGQDNLDDTISGSGLSSNDTLISSTYGGNDYVACFGAQYVVRMGQGNDSLVAGSDGSAWGDEGDDSMFVSPYQGTHNFYGGDGNDRIATSLASSGAATVNAYGGAGNDIFANGSTATSVRNWYGGDGFDVVMNSGSAGIALVLGGTGGVGGRPDTNTRGVEGAMGTQFDDTLTGSASDNLLIGGNNADILSGAAGDDFLIGETRNEDFVRAYLGILRDFVTINPLDPLNSNVSGEWASEFGGLNDSLYGGGGNDVLSGGDGADQLDGGNGQDWTTYLSSLGGVTLDLRVGGIGGFAAGDSFTSIEHVQGSGYDDNLSGSNSANEMRGMNGHDRLDGGDGNDTLTGGEGRDTLTGSNGADQLTGGNHEDVFVFAGNAVLLAVDLVTDMAAAHDEIWLASRVFRGLGPEGLALEAQRFATGAEATERLHRIIYDAETGALMYDADGRGIGAALQFAQLATGLALTADDFVVMA